MVKWGKSSLEFESHTESENLIDNYDPVSDTWGFPQDSEFWDAVKEAHRNGVRGQQKRIAIIDGAFDFNIPKLASQAERGIVHHWAAPAENTNHGTAVALLISTVAPESHFDFYEVATNGRPNRQLLLKALDLAGQSGAMIVNLSLGRRVRASDWWSRLWKEDEPCEICRAASNTASHDKLVLAAVGNAAGQAFCPARDAAIRGIGFQLEVRELQETEEGGWSETAIAIGPSYPQAFMPDYTLMQPKDVLGSSFAVPLISGAIALIDNISDFHKYVTAIRVGGNAELWQALLRPSSSRQDIEKVRSLYSKAFSELPHRHHGAEEGPPCVGCSLFAQDLYVNAGLFALNTNDFALAEELLRAARWLAPWSPHAAANLAALLRAKAEMLLADKKDVAESLLLLRAARNEFLCALKLRPDNKIYISALEMVDVLINRLSKAN